MSIFEDVTLTWDDQDYVVPAGPKLWGLCKTIYKKVPLSQMGDIGDNPPLVAEAFAAALRHAGVPMSVVYTDEDGAEHYDVEEQILNMFFDPRSGFSLQSAVLGIFTIVFPPEHLRKIMGETLGKTPATRKPKAKKKTPSRKRTS